MAHHASLQKNRAIRKKFPARVISMLNTTGEKGKEHAAAPDTKSDKELPLYHNERIFKPKKHDPL